MTTNADPLRAGAAKADITPQLGIQIAGDIGRHRPCTGVREPLFARALALEQAGRRYAILSLDVLAIDNPWSDELRRRIAAACGLAPEAVLVHITQNHGAPSIGNHFCRDTCTLIPDAHSWLRGGDVRYNEPALDGAVRAAEAAFRALTPVTVSAGRAMDGRLAFNRRFLMRDGTARCHPPLCSPDILCIEGPADPEVGVVVLKASDGSVVSALLHHTCHPCHGYGGTVALADWPGAWAREMEAAWGSSCVPLVINGCCGNVHHMDHVNPGPQPTHLQMGAMLAESTQRALKSPADITSTPFVWLRHVVPVPRRVISDELLATARKMLSEHPEPLWISADHTRVSWDWVYAVGILDIADERTTDPTYPYEIQAVRIGDFALLALMGEPFVEAQLAIKQSSPFRFTQVAHMCNGYLGYVPTERAFAGGGYETRTGRGSRLVPEALQLVQTSAIALARELRAGA